MIYTHVLARPDVRVVSPLDRLSTDARSVIKVASVEEPRVEVAAKVDVERVETTEAAEASTPTSVELAEKHVQVQGVKPCGMRALVASVFRICLARRGICERRIVRLIPRLVLLARRLLI